MNFYPEVIESSGGVSQMALYGTPGLSLFATIPGGATSSPLLEMNGRLFSASNGALWEIASNGTVTNRGSMAGNTSLIAGNFYLFIVGNSHAYAFNLATNTLTEVTSSLAKPNPVMGFFLDGYYGVIYGNSNEFQISALEDPTTWSGTDVAQVSVFAENIVGIIYDHRTMWVWSNKHAQIYYNDGAAAFPLSVNPGAFLEQGLNSAASVVRMDNSVFWIGADERGAGIAWRADQFTPTRVSNHAVEWAWSQYPAGSSDAIGWSYQDQGHTFWVLYFPSGNATWVYDAATNMWHQRGHWNGSSQDAWLPTSHAYCFGKHLVSDRASGNIYAMSIDTYTDNGTAIYRTRRAPCINTEMEWIFHQSLQLDMECGIATGSDNPMVSMRFSDDGGKTWSNTYQVSAGMAGQTTQRVIWRRLGRSRRRVYEITVSDSIPWRIIEGSLLASPGFEKIPRLSKYFGAMQ